ncbi:hypothetical protein EDD86DRAFT_208312 [Gorgonomyces haynaldii]|nr:hypothetical protein EDD86DRAFT_208312 [Gorgonomyces haynaldii]
MTSFKKGGVDFLPHKPQTFKVTEDVVETPTVVFPEWVDAEVAAEKFSGKHNFEDPDGLAALPRSLRSLVETTKRVSEIEEGATPVIVPSQQALDDALYASSYQRSSYTPKTRGGEAFDDIKPKSRLGSPPEEGKQGLPKVEIDITPVLSTPDRKSPAVDKILGDGLDIFHGTSKFFQANKHILHSDFMRHFVSSIHYLYDLRKQPGEDTLMPWDLIYPKGKDGLPQYNSFGKFIVKLYWLGSWRKVVVDDRVPLDSQGHCLLATAPTATEIWPIILCKALLKLAAASFKEYDELCEYGDFDFLAAMRGYVPERISITPFGSEANTMISRLFSKNPDAGPKPSTPAFKCTSQSLFAYQIEDVCGPTIRSVPYRCVDLKIIEEGLERSQMMIKIRAYYSAGYKRTPSPKEKNDDIHPEFMDDTWISLEEFKQEFGQVIVYHQPSQFKVARHLVHVPDPTKALEVYKTPYVLYTQEDMREGMLVQFSSFSRVKPSSMISQPSVTIEEYNWKTGVQAMPSLRINTNGVASSLFKPTPGTAYRFVFDCCPAYAVSLLSKEEIYFEEEQKYLQEKHGFKIREFEDSCPALAAGTWHPLIRHQFFVNDATFMLINLYIPESLVNNTMIHVINNDTGEDMRRVNYCIAPQVFEPNKNGYILMCNTRPTTARGACKWKIRMFSENLVQAMSERETLSIKPNIQEIEDAFHPNKHNILFRQLIKVKDAPMANCSFQTQFLQHMNISLTLFDNDVEIASSRGRGSAVIRQATLFQVEDPPKKEEKKEKGAPVQPPPPPKHKYVLQAKLEDIDAEKQISSAGSDNRPNSSRAAKTSSAKSKKKGQPQTVTTGEEVKWKLRMSSSEPSTLLVAKDTEKEDLYKVIKESWEHNAPGRMNMAREVRETYIKMLEQGGIQPVQIRIGESTVKPWHIFKKNPSQVLMVSQKEKKVVAVPSLNEGEESKEVETIVYQSRVMLEKVGTPTVLDPEAINQMQNDQKNLVEDTQKLHQQLKNNRQGDKETRQSEKKMQIDALENKIKELEQWQKTDLSRRDQYRQRLLHEIEEMNAKIKQAQDAAQKAAEALNDPQEDLQDKKKKKK